MRICGCICLHIVYIYVVQSRLTNGSTSIDLLYKAFQLYNNIELTHSALIVLLFGSLFCVLPFEITDTSQKKNTQRKNDLNVSRLPTLIHREISTLGPCINKSTIPLPGSSQGSCLCRIYLFGKKT